MIHHYNAEYQKMIEHLEDCATCPDKRNELTQAILYLETRSIKDQDQIGLAIVQYHKISLLYEDSRLNEIKKSASITLKMCMESNLDYYVIRCYNIMAIVDADTLDYFSSFSNYLKAYYLAEEHPEYKYSAILLNNMGDLFVWLNEHEVAIEYLLQSFSKFQEEDNDLEDVSFLSTYNMIVLNIIEEYSLLGAYDKVEPWVEKITLHEYLEVLQMIININQIDICYQNNSKVELNSLKDNVFLLANPEKNIIYMFRIYLRLLTICIDNHDEETAKKVLHELEVMSKQQEIKLINYSYIYQKHRYYEHFIVASETETIAKQMLKEYAEESHKKMHEFQKTYTRRLIAEKELQEAQYKQRKAEKRRRQLERDLEKDPFTGILNKQSMEKSINHIQCKRNANGMNALLLIDIDYFKQVNDTYGHKRGDEIILEVVEMISSCCTKNMLFGRFGGDEFLLFIQDSVQLDFISALAKELIKFAHGITIDDNKHISLSIGIHIFNTQELFKNAFEKADKALYDTKEKGRDGYTIYEAQLIR